MNVVRIFMLQIIWQPTLNHLCLWRNFKIISLIQMLNYKTDAEVNTEQPKAQCLPKQKLRNNLQLLRLPYTLLNRLLLSVFLYGIMVNSLPFLYFLRIRRFLYRVIINGLRISHCFFKQVALLFLFFTGLYLTHIGVTGYYCFFTVPLKYKLFA